MRVAKNPRIDPKFHRDNFEKGKSGDGHEWLEAGRFGIAMDGWTILGRAIENKIRRK